MIRRQLYFLRTALKGMRRNGEMTVTAIITVTSCLILFGIFMLFSINMNYIGGQIQNQCQLEAFIDFDATEEEERQVVETIQKMPTVEECTFISKSEAMQIYREYLGEDAVALDGLEGEEILRSSVRINMTDLENSQALALALAEVPNVVKVSNRQDIYQRVLDVTRVVRNGSLIAMLILLVVAIFIISNTIKLSVTARRDEVHIMKYVGATAGFIRRPFVLEGILTGVIGGIISLGLVGFAYDAALKFMDGFLDIFDLIPIVEMIPFMAGTTIIFGVIMGAVGSSMALVKHLKV